MSVKAKARQSVQEAEEAARLRAENPPAHPAERGPVDWGEHAGHYTHVGRAHGTGVKCSCGAIVGIITVAFGPDDPPPPDHCEVCEARGIPVR